MLDGWQADIPSVSKLMAIVLLILNIFVPGLGTLLMTCVGGEFRCMNILVAFLQMILTPVFFIGWIWSIWWGIIALEKSS